MWFVGEGATVPLSGRGGWTDDTYSHHDAGPAGVEDVLVRDEVRGNREAWDAMSARYQQNHGDQLARPLVWGMFGVPEADLGVLGDVEGTRVLEFGCGGGQWSTFLAAAGARPVGVDLSIAQLASARDFSAGTVPLVNADGEQLPIRDAAFDVVFCDHGVMSWADPYRTVPEAARVLRPGGLFAFNMTSPLATICAEDDGDAMSTELRRDYFGLHAVKESGTATTYNLPYGEWIRLLVRHGLEVRDLVEIRPGPDATSSYTGDVASARQWARRWPMEALWVAVKRAG
jgi:SAM-dependent methyltransferase